MSSLSLSLFGAPRLEIDGKRIKINRRKAIALLVYLAVTQQSHSRDALATMLWPEADQRRARASLRSALWALKKSGLEEWLLVEGETMALRPVVSPVQDASDPERAVEIDVLRFRHLLAASRGHDHPTAASCAQCLDLLAEAVSLQENDFLTGFTLPDAPEFDEWQFFQVSSLREDLATALRRLIEIDSAQGKYNRAIRYARRLVALDPLHEPAQRTLMELYARAGQQSAALRQYEICRQSLQSELGLEPAEETNALYRRIQDRGWNAGSAQGSPAKEDTAAHTGESRSARSASRHNLPPNPIPFVGRTEELARLAAFLDERTTRLVTITGPGGIGKTRLALAAAAEQTAMLNFPDGVYFVSLAALSEPEAMIPAIAEATGYPFQADQRSSRQQVFDFLAGKSVLLLLDNFEHLLREEQPDGAALVVDLLQQAPHLKLLVTSRESLNLYEEQRYPLQGWRSQTAGREKAASSLPRQPYF